MRSSTETGANPAVSIRPTNQLETTERSRLDREISLTFQGEKTKRVILLPTQTHPKISFFAGRTTPTKSSHLHSKTSNLDLILLVHVHFAVLSGRVVGLALNQRQPLVSPILRSGLVPSVVLFPKMYRGRICNLETMHSGNPSNLPYICIKFDFTKIGNCNYP